MQLTQVLTVHDRTSELAPTHSTEDRTQRYAGELCRVCHFVGRAFAERTAWSKARNGGEVYLDRVALADGGRTPHVELFRVIYPVS